MTRLAVVAYPTLARADHEWLEALRARHDPQASLIGCHFTLVFPAELPTETTMAHAALVVRRRAPIEFVLRQVEPVAAAVGGGHHVFLVPDEGRDEIAALHDALYDGPLRPFLREDVPYLPHITVAGSSELEPCRRLAEELEHERRHLAGKVEYIDLIEVSPTTVRPVERFGLGAKAG